MSRIGKRPVELPGGVTATVSGQTVEVKGPKGTRAFTATDDVTIAVEDGAVTVKPRGTSKRARQQWGMSRTQVANLVTGVTTGFKREMEITGVGYRAAVQGKVLKLSLGYSHDVDFAIPGRRHHHHAEADRDHRRGHRPAGRRPGRGQHPRVAQARALQGQGHQYKGEFIFRKEGKKK